MRLLVVLASMFVIAACGSGDTGGGSDVGGSGGGTGGGDGGTGGAGGTGGTGGAGGTGGGSVEEIDWETCYLDAAGPAECATLEVPLDRGDPASPTIPFFVRRMRAEGEARGQLWLLEGGPGVNGGALGHYAVTYFNGLGLDVYMPDYRGVGRSANLGCATSDIFGCLDELEDRYGEELAHFSSSEAVRDIGEAIERLRKPGEQVFVWGNSYGTLTAHRFLHLFPGVADGVVLDSACGASGCDLIHANVDLDRNAHDIADLCAADAFCREKLGDDPWTKIADVLDRADAGHCPGAFRRVSSDNLRPVLAELMGPYFQPAVGTALIYRLDRCTDADARAVNYFLGMFLGLGSGWVIEDERTNSDLLYFQISFNEFWDESYTTSFIADLERDLVVMSGPMGIYAAFYAEWPWPRYEVPDDVRVWAETETPVLVLNGTLDAQTRHERMLDSREAFDGPGQHVVLVPYSGHGVFTSSTPGSADPSYPCGASITRQFLAAPTADLDLSCVDEQPTPRFDTAPYADRWFATPDLYENVAAARPTAVAPIDDPLLLARLAEARARMRRALR